VSESSGSRFAGFADRADAGRRLGEHLAGLGFRDPVVLGLPRGGVPVAAEVAKALDAPLDVVVVRKLGLPSWPEVAMGAIGEGGVRRVDQDLVRRARLSPDDVAAVERRETAVLDDRLARLRRGRAALDLTGHTAIIVDDGIATGATASVAVEAARRRGADRVVVAVPVGSADAAQRVAGADEVLCLAQPPDFTAVGMHYRDFTPTTDEEVAALLAGRR